MNSLPEKQIRFEFSIVTFDFASKSKIILRRSLKQQSITRKIGEQLIQTKQKQKLKSAQN